MNYAEFVELSKLDIIETVRVDGLPLGTAAATQGPAWPFPEAADYGPACTAAGEPLISWNYPPHEITSGQATQPAQTSRGATAPTATGLLRVAQDGERLGRLAWTPGVK